MGDEDENESIEPDIIPIKLWNIFPPTGQYIRHLCEFAGYQSRDAIMKLKNDDELKNMLQLCRLTRRSG